MKSKEQREEKRNEIMEKCFNCYCENGFGSTGIKALAAACGMTSGNLYAYFENIDELIVQSTAYCMQKVEDDFMAVALQYATDPRRFLEEAPYWTAKNHGKKYRFMYQVYTHPKYLECGKEFFRGVNIRYAQYAAILEPKLGVPRDILLPMIFTFVRASVHYALFEDEIYLKAQMNMIWMLYSTLREKYKQGMEGATQKNE